MRRKTVPDICAATEPVVMLTAYDYWTAQMVDRAGVDIILIGDSLGMVVQGKPNTLSVTMDHVVYHSQAVVRGREKALVIADMPYLSFHISTEDTIRNAGRLISEAGVDGVKLEGGRKRVDTIRALVNAEIPVMGHLGMTPQSLRHMGGFKVQGRSEEAREKIKEDALLLQEAGVFCMVLECVPSRLAQEVTELVSVPTIGIGAGPYCNGQVLVTHDMLGLNFGHVPKFVRQFANLGECGVHAVEAYCDAVRKGEYPKRKTGVSNG